MKKRTHANIITTLSNTNYSHTRAERFCLEQLARVEFLSINTLEFLRFQNKKYVYM